MENKEQQILEIAGELETFLSFVDMFCARTKDKIGLFEETLTAIKNDISYKESALPVIMAMGGRYDKTEDICKAKTLRCVIDLLKVRGDYAEKMRSAREQEIQNKTLLEKMGVL